MTEPLTVLIVDPQGPALARALAGIAQLGVETCASAREALERVERRAPDVVVAAQQLDDGEGLELLRVLSVRRPRIKRALIMAGPSALPEALAAINHVGVERLLCRPFTAAQLATALRSLRDQLDQERRHDALAERALEQYVALQTLNQQLDELVDQRTLDLLNGLLAALAHRDSETQWHSRRVALYTHTMAWMLGLRDAALSDVQRGALLHDIGKIGVPDAIVLKPGPLTEEEWAIMRTHPRIGHDLLSGIDFLHDARQLVLEHHERFDGRGYPDRLAGRDISLGARIFAVADTLDAMTSDRPYRKALPFETAWDEIARQAGSQFDPDVVDAFRAIPRRDWELAVALGQAHERTSGAAASLALAPHQLAAWRESAFVKSFGAIDPAHAWFQISLEAPAESEAAAG